MLGIGKKKQKQSNMVQDNVVPLVNSVIYRQRVQRYHYSCGLANINMKPCEMPVWALNQLATMGIQMLGIDMALKHAESLAIVGIAVELPDVIKTMVK